MYGYIYITTNLVNGKKYIGKHRADRFDEKYKGSGKLICRAFEKYGFENFKTEIIEWCKTKEETENREIYWISYYNAVRSYDFYNIARGGNGGSLPGELSFMYGHKHSEETRKKMSEKGIGRKCSDYTRKKISELKKNDPSICNTKYMNDGVNNFRIREEDVEKKLKEGLVFGRLQKGKINKFVRTEDMKKHMSESAKNKVISNETRKRISQSMTGKKRGPYNGSGRKIVNNGIEFKYVYPDEIDKYLSNGWKQGRIIRNKGD